MSDGEDIFLPIPVAIIVRHLDAITQQGSELLLSGRVADAEAATALALYDALAAEPQLSMVKEYLAGRLDSSFPGPSGKELWAKLVSTIRQLAHDSAALLHQPASPPPSPGASMPTPRPGQLFGNTGPVVAVAHPMHVVGVPPIQRYDHPNAVLFAGTSLTAVHLVKQSAKKAGLFATGNAGGLSIGPSRLASIGPKSRLMVRFTPIKFQDAAHTPGTAILLHGLDTDLLERLRSALLS